MVLVKNGMEPNGSDRLEPRGRDMDLDQEGSKLPYSILTDEQILALLAEQPKIMCVPGVALVSVEFVDSISTEVAVVVTVYAGKCQGVSRLPVTVGGLPVIVKVEDRHTRRVVDVIDPRKNGGAWPSANHDH